MNLARVIGRVVATRKCEGLEGRALLVLQPLGEDLLPSGRSLVAADAIGSGPGEIVFFVGGKEASMALAERFVPVDAAIVGHVEEVAVRGRRVEPPLRPDGEGG
jgi:ethanolamine utilization protein EutN